MQLPCFKVPEADGERGLAWGSRLLLDLWPGEGLDLAGQETQLAVVSNLAM